MLSERLRTAHGNCEFLGLDTRRTALARRAFIFRLEPAPLSPRRTVENFRRPDAATSGQICPDMTVWRSTPATPEPHAVTHGLRERRERAGIGAAPGGGGAVLAETGSNWLELAGSGRAAGAATAQILSADQSLEHLHAQAVRLRPGRRRPAAGAGLGRRPVSSDRRQRTKLSARRRGFATPAGRLPDCVPGRPGLDRRM